MAGRRSARLTAATAAAAWLAVLAAGLASAGPTGASGPNQALVAAARGADKPGGDAPATLAPVEPPEGAAELHNAQRGPNSPPAPTEAPATPVAPPQPANSTPASQSSANTDGGSILLQTGVQAPTTPTTRQPPDTSSAGNGTSSASSVAPPSSMRSLSSVQSSNQSNLTPSTSSIGFNNPTTATSSIAQDSSTNTISSTLSNSSTVPNSSTQQNSSATATSSITTSNSTVATSSTTRNSAGSDHPEARLTSNLQASTGVPPPLQASTAAPPPPQASTGAPPPLQASTGTQPTLQASTGAPPPLQASTGTQPTLQASTGAPPPLQASTAAPAPVAASNSSQPGGRCPERSSCRAHIRRVEAPEKRSCQCDKMCALYDDCCADSSFARRLSERAELGSRRLREDRKRFQCMQLAPGLPELQVRASCMADWRERAKLSEPEARLVERRCELSKRPEALAAEAREDPLGALLPTTGLASGVTYANAYCLQCNVPKMNASAANQLPRLQYWSPLLHCNHPAAGSVARQLVAPNGTHRLEYSGQLRRWLLVDKAAPTQLCSIGASLPESVLHLVRACRAGALDSCPPEAAAEGPDWDEGVSRARFECHFGHQALVLGASWNRVYRNPACAACHRESQLSCELPGPPPVAPLPPPAAPPTAQPQPRTGYAGYAVGHIQEPARPSSAFSLLLDLYGSEGAADEQVGSVHKCPYERQVYDPFFRACRCIVCGLNFTFREGRCVPNSELDKYPLVPKQQKAPEPAALVHKVPSLESTAPAAAAATGSKAPEAAHNTSGASHRPQTVSREHLAALAEVEPEQLLEPSEESRRTFAQCPKMLVGSEHYRLFSLASQQQQLPRAPGGASEGYSMHPAATSAGTSLWAFLLPYKLALDSSQFELVRLNSGAYANQSAADADFRLLVCSPFNSDLVDKFKPAMAYLTQVCLVVSIASLIAYIALHLLSICDLRHLLPTQGEPGPQAAAKLVPSERALGPKNQSLSSMGLACLASSLLAAYLFFIAGHRRPQAAPLPANCRLLALATYYWFLVAFSWMLLLSYDVWRTLRLATCLLRPPSRSSQTSRFLCYLLLSLLASAALASLAALLDSLEEPQPEVAQAWSWLLRLARAYRPRFGERPHSCWFSSRRSLALFFGLPVTGVMMVNLTFFLHTSFMVLSTSADSARGPAGTKSPAGARAVPGATNGARAFLALLRRRPQSCGPLNTKLASTVDSTGPATAPTGAQGGGGGDFSQQNGLTTSSFVSVQTMQSHLSRTTSSGSSLDGNCVAGDESPSPPRAPGRPRPPLEPRLSSPSLVLSSTHSQEPAAVGPPPPGPLAPPPAEPQPAGPAVDSQLAHLASLMATVVKDYRLYCRLSTIMGLSWLAGVLASQVDQSDALWYLFVLLNTLQGLFIFVAFGCKRSKLANARLLLAYARHRLGRRPPTHTAAPKETSGAATVAQPAT